MVETARPVSRGDGQRKPVSLAAFEASLHAVMDAAR
jgi:hypothetical protein